LTRIQRLAVCTPRITAVVAFVCALFLGTGGLCPALGMCQEARVAEKPPGVEVDGDTAPYPKPDTGYVTDLADMLSREEEERIEQWLWRAEEEKGVEIAVVTINSLQDYPGTANDSIESFATELFNRYGIGNLPKNDGVLLLISRRDRKMRIELGKGWGRDRDAAAAGIIARGIKPQFKAERYGDGITAGVRGILADFAGLNVSAAVAGRIEVPWQTIAIAVAAVALAVLAMNLLRSGRSGWGWLTLALCGGAIFALLRGLNEFGKRMPSSSSDNWSSGGSGGGFGGGSSDGGGASGDW
jgi:uncharacterized protein